MLYMNFRILIVLVFISLCVGMIYHLYSNYNYSNTYIPRLMGKSLLDEPYTTTKSDNCC